MPVEPVRELVEEWLGECAADEVSLAERLSASGYWSAPSASRLLWRIRHESDRVSVQLVDKLLVAMDDWRVAEDLGAEEIPPAAVEVEGVSWPRPVVPPVPRSRRRKKLSKAAKLSESQLVAIHKLHTDGGLSLREICRRGWEGWGYASERSALNSVCDLLKLAGLQARDRIEAAQLASTTHGLRPRSGYRNAQERREHLEIRRSRRRRQRCAGSRTQYPRKGERCRCYALDDSSFCRQHDPRFRAAVAADLEVARSRRTAAALYAAHTPREAAAADPFHVPRPRWAA